MTGDDLLKMMQGARAAAVMKAALELEVFESLAGEGRSPGEVAVAVGADPRGMRILLDALAALGVVERDGKHYSLAPVAAEHLVKGGPGYLGGSGQLLTSDHMWRMLGSLPEAVRHGGAVFEDSADTPDHPFWSQFARLTEEMAAMGGARLASLVSAWAKTRRPLSILDIACGTGLYGYSVATEHPHAQVTSQDWPNVLAETRRIALERGLAGRASFVPGDAFEVRLGGPHDLIILSLFLHHFDESRCRLMLDRVARALAPGGKIAIHALAPSGEAPHTDPAPFVFSAVMLAWTRAGEAYPVEFYRRLCQAVGLGTFETHRSAETPSTMMIASRE